MNKFGKAEKTDVPVPYSGQSSFDNFRTRTRQEIN
jgi:hypothetical protein